jgi:hypothetical protein
MRFFFIISHDDQFAPAAELISAIGSWTRKQKAAGVLIDSNPLQPAENAVTVRVRQGDPRRTRGPFARSREKMCAYALIEATSLDAAVDIAASHPMARAATIEVRPVWEMSMRADHAIAGERKILPR